MEKINIQPKNTVYTLSTFTEYILYIHWTAWLICHCTGLNVFECWTFDGLYLFLCYILWTKQFKKNNKIKKRCN